MYQKLPVALVPMEELTGVAEPYVDHDDYAEQLTEIEIESRFSGQKREIVRALMDGDSFLSISQKMHLPTSRVYAIKKELKHDLSFIYEEAKRKEYLERNSEEIEVLLRGVSIASTKLTLSQFQHIYINDYDREALDKQWHIVPLQDRYEQVWETHQKSVVMAPREHLKTTSAITYIVKKVFERTFPLEINYFHLNKDIAIEKIRKLQMIVDRNPILSMAFEVDKAKNWKDGELRLLDGTTIKAMGWLSGAVGKHPHIIVLDDVIDISVVYSAEKNDKSIRKFYSEIYPMITKLTKEKKIIIIGTAQREDDLYAKLPDDFHRLTLQAVVDNQPLEPALFSMPELNKIKSDISKEFGEKFWLKEYMNVPFSAMGMIIKPEWIRTYDVAPKNLTIYQGWDLSVGKTIETGDWTSGATIGIQEVNNEIRIYVLDVYKGRIPFAERLKEIVSHANTWNPVKIGVEENAFQYDTVQTLKKQTNLPIVGIKSVTNKVESFQVELAPQFENGKVYIHTSMEDLRQELLALPAGTHDDQADALKLAIRISSVKTKTPQIRVLG